MCRIIDKIIIVLLFVTFIGYSPHLHASSPQPGPSPAVTAQTGLCFDFSRPITKPLHPVIARAESGEATDSGELPSGVLWGAARGVVAKPIGTILQKLFDPMTLKEPKNTTLKIHEEKRQGFLKFLKSAVKVKAIPFFTIEWDEEMAYVVTDGTETDPREVLVSYQKTAGTTHLGHFCGNLVIRAEGAEATDFYAYEEIKAPRRSREDIIKGHLGTISTLRRQ